MAEEKPEAEVPTGKGGELNRLAREKWCEHLLLFSKVKNRVLEVNPHVNIPLPLEKGKPSPLGLFVEAAFRTWQRRPPKEKHALEVWRGHRRSAILGRVVFSDKEGRCYRDIDLKGIGYVETLPASVRRPDEWSGRTGGLLGRESAFFDYEKSEEFLRVGIRTHRVLAIIGLEELIVKGRTISLQEAVDKDIIVDREFQPVVVVRAFGTKTRISDIRGEPNEKRRKLLFEDAVELVSQELGYKEPICIKDYIMWFARTSGRNVGLMHKNGWHHDGLGADNITLDCRITDLEALRQLNGEREREWGAEEMVRQIDSLWRISGLKLKAEEAGIGRPFQPFAEQFQDSYDSVFPPEERKRYFNKLKQIKQGE